MRLSPLSAALRDLPDPPPKAAILVRQPSALRRQLRDAPEVDTQPLADLPQARVADLAPEMRKERTL